jgi:hypothetical protein
MKTVGIVMLLVDLGALEITKDKDHSVNWQPYVGIGIMVIGGGVLLFGRKGSTGRMHESN